jgi:hypothetical protein
VIHALAIQIVNAEMGYANLERTATTVLQIADAFLVVPAVLIVHVELIACALPALFVELTTALQMVV